MIPITIGVLQSNGATTFFHKFLSSISYVSGISLIYAFLGYMAAKSTIIFGQWMAHPLFIMFIILFFLMLAFSMFGFYEIQIPNFLTQRENMQTKGSFFKIFLFGIITGTVASPCLTPSLAMILAIVAKQASPILGFIALFAFSLGLSVLLVAVGMFSQTIFLFPRAGMWMIEIKKLLGFALLAVCVYFLQPMIAPWMAKAMYGLVVFVAIIYGLNLLIRRKKTITDRF
jgi:thioredoxin:protein disulfide reductase